MPLSLEERAFARVSMDAPRFVMARVHRALAPKAVSAHRLTKTQARRIAVRAQLLDAPRPSELLRVVDATVSPTAILHLQNGFVLPSFPVGSNPTVSVLALMPVATLLSICSEADAFVARAFASTFSVGAILAFMTIGQIIDLRNGFLLFRMLRARLTALIAIVSYVLVLVEGLLINMVMPTL